MGHSIVEHRLRTGIEDRHRLKNEIAQKQSLVNKLSQKLESTKKNRLNNRYSATISRSNAEIEALGQNLKDLNVGLKKRIVDEMEFSEHEIQEFTEQYRKELAEIQETEGKLKEIEKMPEEPEAEESAEEASEDESEDKPVSKEAMVARTKRMLSRERRIVAGIQKELSSEERDKVFFSEELQQIIAELEADGDN
jgi:chromosome segregation ATPase